MSKGAKNTARKETSRSGTRSTFIHGKHQNYGRFARNVFVYESEDEGVKIVRAVNKETNDFFEPECFWHVSPQSRGDKYREPDGSYNYYMG